MEQVEIGDTVLMRCHLPVEYVITAILLTQKAVDEVNENMNSDNPWWEVCEREQKNNELEY